MRITRILPYSVFLLFISLLLFIGESYGQTHLKRTTLGIPALKQARSVWGNFDIATKEPELLLTGIDSTGKIHTQIYQLKDSASRLFAPIGQGLDSLYRTSTAISDFNHDQLIDILVAGLNQKGKSVTRLLINRGGGRFEKVDTLFPGLHSGGVLWVDLNNDGRKDVLLHGLNEQNRRVTMVYRNTTKGFLTQKHNLPGFSDGSWVTLHLDKDSRPDLYLNGLDSTGKPFSALYKNKDGLTFELLPEQLIPLYKGSSATGDFNADGLTDLLIAGLDSTKKPLTKLYFQEERSFRADTFHLPGVYESSIYLAELNNDGLTDVLISGTDTAGKPLSKVWLNTEEGVPFDTIPALQKLTNSYVSLADITGDGNLELFQTGDSAGIAKVYYWENRAQESNYGPSAASNPTAFTIGNRTIFSWAPAADDTAPTSALSYELYVFNPDSASLLKTLEAGSINNKRNLVAHGSQGQFTSLMMFNLPDGILEWGVQAVDNAFETKGKQGICQGGGLRNCRGLAIHRQDTTVCAGSTLTLTLPVKGSTLWYSVQKGLIGTESKLVYQASQRDTLFAVVFDVNQCLYNYSLSIDTTADPSVAVSPDATITEGESVPLWVSGGTSYQWSPAAGLSDPAIANPIASPKTTTTYTVKISNGTSCFVLDSIKVTVIPKKDNPVPPEGTEAEERMEVFIPNLFTPNDDGRNDEFKVYGQGFATIHLQVYDRMGTLVYETNNVNSATVSGWDGTNQGKPLPNGTYFWTLNGTFRDGSPIRVNNRKTGVISLLR